MNFSQRYDHFRPFILMLAAISFGMGICLPIIRFEKLWLFEEPVSLLGLVGGLWDEGSILLAAIVISVSVIFPIIKMAMAAQAIHQTAHLPAWAKFLANWSMMDVLLVAIVIFASKTSGLASAFAEPGLWFYALATILTVVAMQGLKPQEQEAP